LGALKFFGSDDFRKILSKLDDQAPRLRDIATSTFDAALVEPNQFFIFEIISDTELIRSNLTPQQLDILEIFVNGTIDQFNQLMADPARSAYIKERNLDIDVLTFKMRVLTFVTIAHGKATIGLEEAAAALKVSPFEFRRLIVQINEISVAREEASRSAGSPPPKAKAGRVLAHDAPSVARVRLDAVKGVCIIEYCQPRRFTDDTWAAMASHLERLMNSWQTE